MLTFDRYLIRSFLHVFGVCFVAMFGLVVVIDLLENLDDFISRNGEQGSLVLMQNIGQYYGYQSLFFLDRGGPTLMVVSVMVVLLLFRKSGELRPLLAAGVPMYRILSPLVAMSAGMSGLFSLNQELVIPRIAFAAYEARGGTSQSQLRVEPTYDRETRISIDGQTLRLADRTIEQAEFVLPAPLIAREMTTLKSAHALHRAAKGNRPAGWLLRQCNLGWDELLLTERGQQIVRPGPTEGDLFVVTSVTCDQLYKRNSSYALLSTAELLRRIRSPSVGLVSAQRMVVHLHSRFVQPLLNVVIVLLVLPLIVRRESLGMVVDAARCSVTLIALFGLVQAAAYVGQLRLAPPDVMAWMPALIGGAWAAWSADAIES